MAVDPAATLISPESLQAAELISNVAYGSTGFGADANLTQDPANIAAAGWIKMAPGKRGMSARNYDRLSNQRERN